MKTSFQAYRRKREAGQALVETAIIYPVMIFMILGIIQLTMLHQCRLMMEYAAFNAARTGAVWNGNPVKMRRAAQVSLIATRPSFPGVPSLGSISNFKDLIAEAALSMATQEIADSLLGIQLIRIKILSPTIKDFGDKEEIDFDDFGSSFEKRRLGQLSIRLTYFYRLYIPFANWVIWNAWYEYRCTTLKDALEFIDLWNDVVGSMGWNDLQMNKGQNRRFLAFKAPNYAMDAEGIAILMAAIADDDMSNDYEGLEISDWAGLVLGAEVGGYYIPMVTSYTIRSQSNIFKCSVEGNDKSACNDEISGEGGA